MIQIGYGKNNKYEVRFCEDSKENRLIQKEEKKILSIGLDYKKKNRLKIREACARAVKMFEERNVYEFAVDVSMLLGESVDYAWDIAEGLSLGAYHQRTFKHEKPENVKIELIGVPKEKQQEVQRILDEAKKVMDGVLFARDMVNLPGNFLRPLDFAREIENFAKPRGVEVEIIHAEELRKMGMNALLAVGDSSAYPPCMAILRYFADSNSNQVIGLVGKGVTCDTGGYCLKPAGSMMGIKGDMAGGAAVIGAISALAANHVKTNAVAVVPICENRISNGSLLPGDVISSYAKKTIEICNTDAEGRLILADALAYAVENEKNTRVLDIATLTGAVVNLLGFSIGGAICDNDAFYQDFEKAYHQSEERYLRIPFYQEHEKMIESQIADIKNMGESYCGTISAGLFIRAFAKEIPWLHLDIAGTAWVDTPVFEFQSKGATGAGVTSIYQLCKMGGVKV